MRMLRCLAMVAAMVVFGSSVADSAVAAEKEVVAAVERISEMLGKEKVSEGEIPKAAAERSTKFELFELMEVFGRRRPNGTGGLGIGKTPGVIKPDFIERKLLLVARSVGQAELKEYRSDLVQMATRIAAVGAMTEHLAPAEAKRKNPKDWEALSRGMFKLGSQLSKSLKANDIAAIKKATTELNKNCMKCHQLFRD